MGADVMEAVSKSHFKSFVSQSIVFSEIFLFQQVIGVISTHQKIGRNEAVEYVKKLQQQGRYVQELWTTA